MSCWSVNSFNFSREKSNELTDQHDMFCFNHASAFYTRKTSWKMLINNKFKAQTLTGNPTGYYRCQLIAPRALNISCSFNQSARSIESRCVVIHITCIVHMNKEKVQWYGLPTKGTFQIRLIRVFSSDIVYLAYLILWGFTWKCS